MRAQANTEDVVVLGRCEDPLVAFPEELLLQVLAYVGHVEVCRLAQVSVRWRQFVDTNQALWKQLFKQLWTQTGLRVRGTAQWKANFHKQWEIEGHWRTGTANSFALQRPSAKKKSPVTCVRHHGDVLISASSADAFCHQHDLESHQVTNDYTGHGKSITSMWMNNVDLITASADKTLRIWDVASGLVKYELAGHKKAVTSVSVCANYVASGSKDKTVRIWDRKARGKLVCCSEKQKKAFSAVHMPAVNVVAAGDEAGDITLLKRVWQAGGGENGLANLNVIRSFNAHNKEVTAVRYNSHHQCIVSVGVDGNMQLLRPSGRVLDSLVGHAGEAVYGVQCNNLRLVTWGGDGTVAIWDWRTHQW